MVISKKEEAANGKKTDPYFPSGKKKKDHNPEMP
jgi:hypothetical protein